jgi:heme/copper-type cytochrome/quinol oxidase subunit 2
VKQDAVPGLVIPVWFEIEKAGEYELVCAELCGWGHYKMKARIIAESEESYQSTFPLLRLTRTKTALPMKQRLRLTKSSFCSVRRRWRRFKSH